RSQAARIPQMRRTSLIHQLITTKGRHMAYELSPRLSQLVWFALTPLSTESTLPTVSEYYCPARRGATLPVTRSPLSPLDPRPCLCWLSPCSLHPLPSF